MRWWLFLAAFTANAARFDTNVLLNENVLGAYHLKPISGDSEKVGMSSKQRLTPAASECSVRQQR